MDNIFQEKLFFHYVLDNQIFLNSTKADFFTNSNIKEIFENIFKNFSEYNAILVSYKKEYITLINQTNIDLLKTNYDSLISKSVVLEVEIKNREEIKNTLSIDEVFLL